MYPECNETQVLCHQVGRSYVRTRADLYSRNSAQASLIKYTLKLKTHFSFT